MKNSGFFRKFTAGITAILTCFSMLSVASYADEIIYGDVNCDGVVTALDLMNMKEYLIGKKTLTDEQKTNSDMNSDLSVNIIDLVLLKQAFIENSINNINHNDNNIDNNSMNDKYWNDIWIVTLKANDRIKLKEICNCFSTW